MWKAAWKTSFNSPLLGHGLHQANKAVLPYVESPNTKKRIGGFTHLHDARRVLISNTDSPPFAVKLDSDSVIFE